MTRELLIRRISAAFRRVGLHVKDRQIFATVVALASVATLTFAYWCTVPAVSANLWPQRLQLGSADPGSIVSTTSLTAVTPEIRALSAASVRIVYRSTHAPSGELVEVSGAFFVPTGTAPAGGWPVVAVAHQGEGTDEPCAPSRSSSLLGNAPLVATLLKSGYAVTVSDYAGLGEPGRANDYLDVTTAGRNVIDSVRALRAAFPDISNRWAAFGTRLGGAAVWAADQQAAGYAAEMNLVGAAARSPLGDLAPLLERARTGSLTIDQRKVLLWSMTSLSRQHPGLNLDDYRRGAVANDWDAMTKCFGADVGRGELAIAAMGTEDLAPSTPTAAAVLDNLVHARALPDLPFSAPLSVVNDSDDAVVDPQWNNEEITKACRRGDSISWRTDAAPAAQKTNGNALAASTTSQIGWLANRFAGMPLANGCGSVSVSSPGAGTLLSTEDIPGVAVALGLPAGARAARVTYQSTQGDTGSSTVVSGTVFAPAGDPPPGGWAAFAFGHGTTGIQQECGPSVLLQGSDSWLAAAVGPPIAKLLELGFAVSFPDYEGLGAPGVHRYIDFRTAGLNMIDSVRALRAAFPGVSTRWAAIGTSQGAGATWSADEQSDSYAPELQLIGAVALAPPADLTGIVDKVISGDITPSQLGVLQLILASLAREDVGLDVDEFRRGSAAENWEVLSSCDVPEAEARSAALKALTPADLAPATPEAADKLRDLLARRKLPQHRMSAPIFIVYGTGDLLIDSGWISGAIARACALGGTIAFEAQDGRGHDNLDVTPALSWLLDRFANRPVVNDCPGRA
ncbi:Secretory lipase [Mycolicibacterium fluoranthenivorans]|uniref:Secretory lipase n=1 Tax=Mycolicibacterium fluoranthenivorans TaxID=258505 RepID=A0A1G4V791_9MYCO|nr:Secretory lipase [Mycolicibacterium fluoranthenivorans]